MEQQTYRGEAAAYQDNEERWKGLIIRSGLIGGIIAIIGSGIWFHLTAVSHNLSYSELMGIIGNAIH